MSKITECILFFAENWSAISFLAWLIHRFLHARQHSQSWDVSPLTDRWSPALSRAQSAKQPSKCYSVDKMPLSFSWQAKTLTLICVSPSHSGSRLIKTIFTADKEILISVKVNSKELINRNGAFYLPLRMSNSCKWTYAHEIRRKADLHQISKWLIFKWCFSSSFWWVLCPHRIVGTLQVS